MSARSPMSWPRRWSTGACATCSGWSGIPTSAWRTPCAARRRPATDLYRDPPRGRCGVCRLRVRQADRTARGVPDDRRTGSNEPAHWSVGRERRPLAGTGADRPGRHPGARTRARSRKSTSRLRSERSPRWTQPVLETSKHAELMTLACKHAILQQGPAHLIFPDEVQTLAAGNGDAPAARMAGSRRLRSARRRVRSTQALELIATAEAPGDHRRPRRPLPARPGDRARRAARRAGDHDVQGQGPDRRRPSARVRGRSDEAAPQSRAGS